MYLLLRYVLPYSLYPYMKTMSLNRDSVTVGGNIERYFYEEADATVPFTRYQKRIFRNTTCNFLFNEKVYRSQHDGTMAQLDQVGVHISLRCRHVHVFDTKFLLFLSLKGKCNQLELN